MASNGGGNRRDGIRNWAAGVAWKGEGINLRRGGSLGSTWKQRKGYIINEM